MTTEENDFNPEFSYSLVESGALLIDVRTRSEFTEAHVQGAINIPHNEILESAEEIFELVERDQTKNIVVYCKSGGRSGFAKKDLLSLGYKSVVNHGGFCDWKK